MNFGKELKEMREAKKLSPKELAEKVGITERLLIRFENNTSKPTDEVKEKLINLLKEKPNAKKTKEVKKDSSKAVEKNKLKKQQKTVKKLEEKEESPKSLVKEEKIKNENKATNKVIKKEKSSVLVSHKKEEIKKENIILNEEKVDSKNKKVKTNNGVFIGLSKAIYVIAKIMKICLYITLPFIALGIVLLPSVVSRIKVTDNTISFRTVDDNEFKITGENLSLSGGYKITYNDVIISDEIQIDLIQQLKELFKEENVGRLILSLDIALIICLISVYAIIIFLKNLERFAKNLYTLDTPFVKDNIDYLKNMGYFMLFVVICNLITAIIVKNLASLDIDSGINTFNILEVLSIFVLSYVFEHGYELENQK